MRPCRIPCIVTRTPIMSIIPQHPAQRCEVVVAVMDTKVVFHVIFTLLPSKVPRGLTISPILAIKKTRNLLSCQRLA